MKDPAMLFYTSDFLTGVQLMSMKERGQYITLLCLQQQRGHMTQKEMEKAVGKMSGELLSKFVRDEDGKLYNKRADYEIKRREARTRKRSENAEKRRKAIGDTEGQSGRNTASYAFWRKCVFERDHYTCQMCGQVSGRLNAHHIERYRNNVARRTDETNGITLCEACHRALHKKEGR